MEETLSDYKFVPNAGDKIVHTPTTIREPFGKLIYGFYEQAKRERFDNNPNFKLQYRDGELIGSTPQDAILLDELVKPFGIRTANPRDLGDKGLLQIIKGRYYVDSTGLVLRSTEDSYDKRINALARSLAEHVNMQKLQTKPALITGFKVIPSNDKGYGFLFVPGDNFIR